MSDTPLTDAMIESLIYEYDASDAGDNRCTMIEFAQALERQVSFLQKALSAIGNLEGHEVINLASTGEHWLITLAREVAGSPGARAALNSSFVHCVKDLVARERLDDVRAAVAALAEAEAILEGKL